VRQQQIGRRRARRRDAEGPAGGEEPPPATATRVAARTARVIESIDEVLAAC
jgi:hypothetical protein